MRKSLKVILSIAGVCLLSGAILSGVGFLLGGEPGFMIGRHGIVTSKQWSQTLEPSEYEVMEKTKTEELASAVIRVNYEDIEVLDSGDDSCYIEYRIPVWNKKVDFSVKDGVLELEHMDERNNSYNSGINFFTMSESVGYESGYIKLYLPEQKELESIVLENEYGDITGRWLSAKDAVVTGKYGAVELKGVRSGRFRAEASRGSLTCRDVKADTIQLASKYGAIQLSDADAETLSIDARSGGTDLRRVAAKEVAITGEYGELEGEDIESDSFTADMSHGSSDLVFAAVRLLNIDSIYGEVSVRLPGNEDDYNYRLHTKYGTITVNDHDAEEDYVRDHGAPNRVDLTSKNGGVEIKTN